MPNSSRDLLEPYLSDLPRYHNLLVTLAYIGMALLASSLLEAYGLWETVARMLPK